MNFKESMANNLFMLLSRGRVHLYFGNCEWKMYISTTRHKYNDNIAFNERILFCLHENESFLLFYGSYFIITRLLFWICYESRQTEQQQFAPIYC